MSARAGINIEVLDIIELGALVRSEPRNHGNLFVSLAKNGNLVTVDAPGGCVSHIKIGDSSEVCSVGIYFKLQREPIFAPVVPDSGGFRNTGQNPAYTVSGGA